MPTNTTLNGKFVPEKSNCCNFFFLGAACFERLVSRTFSSRYLKRIRLNYFGESVNDVNKYNWIVIVRKKKRVELVAGSIYINLVFIFNQVFSSLFL